MKYIDIMDVKAAVKSGALKVKVNDIGDILLADVYSGEAAKIGELPVGRWFGIVEDKLDTHTGEYLEEVYYNCLECDYASDWASPFCPNCGARMKGENDG